MGLEETAEGDVAGAVTRRLLGQRQLRMTGGTDNRLAAEQGPGGCQRTIFLAQVQANAQARGQLGIIVDDQLSTVAGAELLQRIGLAPPPRLVAGLVSILQQAFSAAST